MWPETNWHQHHELAPMSLGAKLGQELLSTQKGSQGPLLQSWIPPRQNLDTEEEYKSYSIACGLCQITISYLNILIDIAKVMEKWKDQSEADLLWVSEGSDRPEQIQCKEELHSKILLKLNDEAELQ